MLETFGNTDESVADGTGMLMFCTVGPMTCVPS
jgi:hypothetical protein